MCRQIPRPHRVDGLIGNYPDAPPPLPPAHHEAAGTGIDIPLLIEAVLFVLSQDNWYQGHFNQNPSGTVSFQEAVELLQMTSLNQPPEISIALVSCDGCLLRYVWRQTPEICLAAISNDPWALQFVLNQTPEICLAAVNGCGNVLELVIDQTPEICLAAARQIEESAQRRAQEIADLMARLRVISN